ncbi:caspase domain-containing protein [Kitasatospora sp. NPDC090091]|uniref:caspase family protein n=1 Tax=Kitasatospora sp. NPDC090091 TaxID=3364081 RepID=UPI00381C312F
MLSDPQASHAVLIGVHSFTELEDLPAVRHNLAALSRLFTDTSLWGLPPDRCIVVEQPGSADVVLDAVSKAAKNAENTLVVYYAGHGLVHPQNDELYLALQQSRPDRWYQALRYEDLRQVMLGQEVRATRKVLVLDCCWSGRALVGVMSGTGQVGDEVAITGTCVLTATSETRKALAPPGEIYTAFTGELVRALEHGVAGAPELLDMDTLYRTAYQELREKGRPLPQQRNRNTAGRICLARNRSWSLPTIPRPTLPHSTRVPSAQVSTPTGYWSVQLPPVPHGCVTVSTPGTHPNGGSTRVGPQQSTRRPVRDVLGTTHPRHPDRSRRRRFAPRVLVIAGLSSLLVVGGAAFGGYRWTQTQYYVGADGDHVSVYRGINQTLAGVSLSSPYVKYTDVELKYLPAYQRRVVTNSIPTENLAEAQDQVKKLSEQASVCKKVADSARFDSTGGSEGERLTLTGQEQQLAQSCPVN